MIRLEKETHKAAKLLHVFSIPKTDRNALYIRKPESGNRKEYLENYQR